MHQLIFTAFDTNSSLQVCGSFQDFSNAFNRKWWKELLYKLKYNGIYGPLLSLLEPFFYQIDSKELFLMDNHLTETI